MAKRGGRPPNVESISGYFRQIIKERPELLGKRSNEYLLTRWLEDHPGEKAVPQRVKQNLANLKSHLRRQRRRRRKAGQEGDGVKAGPSVSARNLEALEEHIDDSLTLARNLDRTGLENVIKLLRKARNEVVWKLGQ